MPVSVDSAVSLTASKSLVEALKTAARVTPRRSTLKVLHHVHLTFNGSDLTIEATDLEMFYEQTLFLPDLSVTEPFAMVVRADAMTTLKPSAVLVFNPRADNIYGTYTIGGITYKPEFDSESFPNAPSLSKDAPTVNLTGKYFADLASCAVAASTFEVRPVLTGVCHRGSSIFATDALRLHMADQPNVLWTQDVNVPAKFAPVLHKSFGKSGAYMTYGDTHAFYKGNGYEITVRLIDGHYPDVTRIFPTSHHALAAFRDTKPWIEALDQALKAHKQSEKEKNRSDRDRDPLYSAWLEADGTDTAHLRSTTAGIEFKAQLSISVDKSVRIAIDARYLRAALEHVGDGCWCKFDGPNKPFVLESSSDKPYRRTALVSPVRIK